VVPDNTQVAVIKACLYEPQANRTPAKAGVEAAALIIERWLLGRLRHRRFYNLAELNAAIIELLRQLDEERRSWHLTYAMIFPPSPASQRESAYLQIKSMLVLQ
jgi:hypothetical protein